MSCLSKNILTIFCNEVNASLASRWRSGTSLKVVLHMECLIQFVS